MTTTYKFTVDRNRHAVAFTLDRAANDIAKIWTDRPAGQAIVARAAAMYFLEMAHKLDHCDDFIPAEYTTAARLEQFNLAAEENPIFDFGGITE